MKRTVVILLVLLAAAAAVATDLPPRTKALSAEWSGPRPIRGALHVHTRRSDGTGTPDTIAAAAARAGLQFVVLTDHEDAASERTKPYYRSGVLLIEGAEISTDGGHVVALDLPRSPYPLGGEARDVIEDVARLGGMSIAAHPVSPKLDLRWLEWSAPVDGVEWLNGDSEWRDESAATLARALLTYPWRRAETLARLLDRPDTVFRRWDVLAGRRPVVGVAAADAHARIGLRSGDPDDPSPALHLPSYEVMFRTLSIALPGVSLTGDASADAGAVLSAIRHGHVYSSIDALAAPAMLAFSAVVGQRRHVAGDVIPAGSRDVLLEVDSNAPPDARVVLLRNGEPMATEGGRSLRQMVGGERAVYRVEIQLPDGDGTAPLPWVVSNPIYVGLSPTEKPPARPPATEVAQQYDDGFATDWTVETSARSKGALDVVPAAPGTQLSLRWALGGTRAESPFAALVMPAGPALAGYDRVMFTGRADRPLRLSVQIRVPDDGGGERWHRSVYLDESARSITVFFDDMIPRGITKTRRPVLSLVGQVLFVVDTVNAKPGASGQIWIDDVKYGR